MEEERGKGSDVEREGRGGGREVKMKGGGEVDGEGEELAIPTSNSPAVSVLLDSSPSTCSGFNPSDTLSLL